MELLAASMGPVIGPGFWSYTKRLCDVIMELLHVDEGISAAKLHEELKARAEIIREEVKPHPPITTPTLLCQHTLPSTEFKIQL